MTQAARTIRELQAAGFSVSLAPGEQIYVAPKGPHGPDIREAAALLEALKAQKTEAMALLRAERDMALREIYVQAVRAIEEVLFHGMLEHINRKHPDAWAEILRAEEAVESAWRQAEAGTISLEQFRAKVDRWRDLHLGMAQEHAAKTCQECPQETVIRCKEQWRERDQRTRGQKAQVWTEPPPGCGRRQ